MSDIPRFNNRDEMFEFYESKIKEAQLNQQAQSLNQAQQDMVWEEQTKGIITEQLDLGEILDRMHNILKGRILENGQWVMPKNNDLVILSEHGVNYVMWMLQSYLTKNTLLSYYNEEQINQKMEDFATTLADNIFMEYDKMFLYPTLEECKRELKHKIQKRIDIRKFALELMEQEVDEKKIEKQILSEMEGTIEGEMKIITEQKMKNKLKRFDSLCRMIQDCVHSAYQRAYHGQERSTLRQHTHITETKGGMMPIQQQNSINPFAVFRRR